MPVPLPPPIFERRTFSEPWGRGEKPSLCGHLLLYLMTAIVLGTATMLSPGLMFSNAGEFGAGHSFIVVCCQQLRPLTEFELDVPNSAFDITLVQIL